jgi:hypothetical protein
MFLDDAPTTVTASCCPNINGMFLFRSLKLANLQQGGMGSLKDACHILGHKIVADLHVLFCAFCVFSLLLPDILHTEQI